MVFRPTKLCSLPDQYLFTNGWEFVGLQVLVNYCVCSQRPQDRNVVTIIRAFRIILHSLSPETHYNLSLFNMQDSLR